MIRCYYLKNSDRLTDDDKQQYEQILLGTSENTADSLRLLSQLLFLHYDKKVVILIDEYDVPLDKAFQNGYYSEMTSLIRGILGQALKTNDYLQFAVLTGCLRISKESIFTGLNNFKVLSIADARFDEQFGFTDSEVRDILEEYGVSDKISEVKDWYDGYRFGKADVYCPWDVMNYMRDLQQNPEAAPASYWKNTSDDAVIRSFIEYAGSNITKKLETLLARLRHRIFQKALSGSKKVRLTPSENEAACF